MPLFTRPGLSLSVSLLSRLSADSPHSIQAVITLTQLGVPDALEHGPKTSEQLAAELKVNQPFLERLLRLSERMGLIDITDPPEAVTVEAAVAAAAAAAAAADAAIGADTTTTTAVVAPRGTRGSSSSGNKGRSSWSSGSSNKGRTSWSSSSVHISEGQLYHLTQLSAVLCESHVNSVKHMVLLFGEHFVPFSYLTQGIKTGETPYKLYSGGLSHWEHMQKEPELYEQFNK